MPKKILIVDDVELNRAILGELFKDQYEIVEAENGVEAIKALEEYHNEIAVMLLDIIMPVMDGFGVLQEMAKNGWANLIPVIVITSDTSEGVMLKGYEMGVTDIINKPFVPNIVRRRVHNVVEQYEYKMDLERLVQHQTDALRAQEKRLRENSGQMIDILSAVIEFKNVESVEHIHNIRTLTRHMMHCIATMHTEYGVTEELVEIIAEAAAMHDIGKVAIPDAIINKPSRLTADEFEVMKTHSVRGCEILEKLANVSSLDYYDYCYEICRHHHERWDGRGYPDGLVGDETPIWAQAVAIADVYDALVSKRVYKEAYSHEKAVEMILAGECGAFNPVIIECFISAIPVLKSEACKDETYALPITSLPENSAKTEERLARVTKDISDRTLHLLEMERQKYKIMSEISGEILFDYDLSMDRLVFSDKFKAMTGRNPEILHMYTVLRDTQNISQEDYQKLNLKLSQITRARPACKMELRLNLSGNGFEWFSLFMYPVWDIDGSENCVGYIGKLINIDRQKKENLKLMAAANNDPLTDVLNRKAAQTKICQILAGGLVKEGSLCFIDIDNFKAVNDNYGHQFGDMVLKRVSGILTACARKNDLVARIGGDEFVMFFMDLSDADILGVKLNEISKSLQDNFESFHLSGSIGAAFFPQHGTSFEELLGHADQALHVSKNRGKNCYTIYDEKIDGEGFHSLQSEMDS